MKKIKAYSFAEMIESAQKKFEAAIKEFEENGGICLLCKKNPGEENMHCKECNAETEELLKQLRGPGFMEFKIPVK